MTQAISERIQSAFQEAFPESARLYQIGCTLFPSGVTHDSRYLRPFPVYIRRASGSKKWCVDGNELIDYWMGHGALLLGHSHPAIVDAVSRQAGVATHPGGCHELELEWGEWVQRLVPSAELVRFTSSGTEATLMAVRIARLVSGNSKIIKFAGHFHGWHDSLTPAADPPYDGSVDYSASGIPPGVVGDLVIVPPNDLDAVARAIDEHDPACVIHEGNGGHWGTVPVRAPFLQGLRRLTKERNVLFILDEVITGFRVHPGGFQAHTDVRPDMTTLAKVLAGGLPGGCLAGRAELLQALAFDNPFGKKMKHPGTYNANPLSAAAGSRALEIVSTGEPCRIANQVAKELRTGLNRMFQQKAANWVAYGDFSAIKIHPEYDGPPPDGDDFIPFNNELEKLDRSFEPNLSHAFRCALLLGGVDWMGWGGSTSSAHTRADVDRTISAFSDAIDRLRNDGLIA